jgi:hypothetical protein
MLFVWETYLVINILTIEHLFFFWDERYLQFHVQQMCLWALTDHIKKNQNKLHVK